MANLEHRVSLLEAKAQASKRTPELAEMTTIDGLEHLPIFNPATGKLEKVKSSLLGIGGVSVDNNIIPKFINIPVISETPSGVAAGINNLPNFTITGNQQYYFVTHRLVLSGQNDYILDIIASFWIWNKGKGNYGLGGTPAEGGDVFMIIQHSTVNYAPIRFDLGEIGTQNIEDVINGTGPYGMTAGTTIVFEATRNGEEYSWLWKGNVLNIGVGYPPTDASVFVLLNDIVPEPADTSDFISYEEFNNSLYDTAKNEVVAGIENTDFSDGDNFYVIRNTSDQNYYFASKETNIEDFVGSRIYLPYHSQRYDLGEVDFNESGYNIWKIGENENPVNTEYHPFQFWIKKGGGSTDFNGNRTVTRNGVPNINVGGETIGEFLNNYFFPAVQPIVGLTNVSQSIEKGSDISGMTINISFDQNDAGEATGYSLERNGIEISTTQNNSIDETNITSAIQYRGFVSYEASDGIPAGTKNSPMRTITPRLYMWYGAVSAIPATSAAVRAMPDYVWDNQDEITLNTGTTQTNFTVAVPSSKTTAASLDAQDITNNIALTYDFQNTVTVNLPTGAQQYRVYALSVDNAYPANAQHKISI